MKFRKNPYSYSHCRITPDFLEKMKSNEDIAFYSSDLNNSDTLLIHIHGGAYIQGSTFGQESYLRDWCNTMGIPFLGIDYGLSPEHKYPEQINECFQAYMWILKNAKEELCMDIKNIIISGDSAGANMLLSLVFLLITMNQYENLNHILHIFFVDIFFLFHLNLCSLNYIFLPLYDIYYIL